MLEEILIYPVPLQESLNISNAEKVQRFEIFNLNGSLVMSKNHNGSSQLQIQTDSFGKGIYLIKVYSQEGVRSQKIIK